MRNLECRLQIADCGFWGEGDWGLEEVTVVADEGVRAPSGVAFSVEAEGCWLMEGLADEDVRGPSGVAFFVEAEGNWMEGG